MYSNGSSLEIENRLVMRRRVTFRAVLWITCGCWCVFFASTRTTAEPPESVANANDKAIKDLAAEDLAAEDQYIPSYVKEWARTHAAKANATQIPATFESEPSQPAIETAGVATITPAPPLSTGLLFAESLDTAQHDLTSGMIESESPPRRLLSEANVSPDPSSPSDRIAQINPFAVLAQRASEPRQVTAAQEASSESLLLPPPGQAEGKPSRAGTPLMLPVETSASDTYSNETATESLTLPPVVSAVPEPTTPSPPESTDALQRPSENLDAENLDAENLDAKDLDVEVLVPSSEADVFGEPTFFDAEPAFIQSDDGSCDSPGSVHGPEPLETVPFESSYTRIPSLFQGGQQRPALVFEPAVPARDPAGRQILTPRVHVAEDEFRPVLPTPPDAFSPVPLQEDRIAIEQTPLHPAHQSPWYEDIGLSQMLSDFKQRRRRPVANALGYLTGGRARPYDVGVGAERLPFALFEMDASQPQNHTRVRFESGYDWENPDRAEFLWSKLGGRGPQLTTPPESSVDYQDIRLISEVGGDKFSLTTELPLRFVDPTTLGNSGGFGDMVLTTKTVLFTGKQFQMTQVLRNQLATGAPASGRGTGHASMEPGFLFRYQRSCHSMMHSELKLRFPIAGDPDHSGPILRYGFGYARILRDSDTFAVIPTFEVVGWSVLSGRETVPSDLLGIADVNNLDGLNIVNLYPGVRIVRDAGGDLGVFELGFGAGLTVTSNHWYESMLRMDIAFGF
ncbi:MAG: hypothetical protein AAF802_02645 [Planctomycetota bacterium]